MARLLARADRFFLWAGLLSGGVFALVTPPFQTPDEPAHFFHSYAVSEGRLAAVHRGGQIGNELPASLGDVASELLGDVPFHSERKVEPEAIAAMLAVPLAEEKRRFLNFRGSALWSFVPFLPQAAGIALGRLAGAPALVLLYLARFSNLLVATLVIVFAVRQVPAFRWLTAMVALTPMALCVRASASVDATTTAAAFLLVATAAKLAWGDAEAVRRRDWLLLPAIAAVVCLTKPAYIPLALVPLVIPRSRFPAGRHGAVLLAHLLISGLAAAYALQIAGAVDVTLRPDAPVDADRQVQSALAEPLRFARIVAVDYARHTPRYVAQLVGKLGWADTPLPVPFLLAYACLLAALLVLDAGPGIRVEPWQRAVLAASLLAVMGLISASQYAVWTPYRADYIEGIQGRYFLPIATAGAWLLHNRRFAGRWREERFGPWLGLASAVSLAVSVATLVERYYG